MRWVSNPKTLLLSFALNQSECTKIKRLLEDNGIAVKSADEENDSQLNNKATVVVDREQNTLSYEWPTVLAVSLYYPIDYRFFLPIAASRAICQLTIIGRDVKTVVNNVAQKYSNADRSLIPFADLREYCHWNLRANGWNMMKLQCQQSLVYCFALELLATWSANNWRQETVAVQYIGWLFVIDDKWQSPSDGLLPVFLGCSTNTQRMHGKKEESAAKSATMVKMLYNFITCRTANRIWSILSRLQ